MKSTLSIHTPIGYAISTIGSILLTLLTPTSLKAQAIGDMGTNRKQQTCPSRSEPRTGVISAAQAKIYATCEAEADRIVKRSGRTDFIDIFSLEVNPKPRQAEYLDINYFGKAIANSAVYEIRGTAVAYSCAALSNRAGGGRPGKNCLNTHVDDRGSNNAVGVCFQETSGFTKAPRNWRCRLSIGTKALGLQYGPPPVSTNALGSSSENQIATNDNSEAFYKRQSRLKWINDDYQGALIDFNRAIQIFPNNAYFYSERGSLKHYHLKDRSGAIEDWQQAAKLYRQQGNTELYELMLNSIKRIQ
jgi:tetratricopeptide (TPR) repeat protein